MASKALAHPASPDLAATPSGPSPQAVSGKAGIPCAGLAKLREPFPPNAISKLPKETKAQREAREKNRDLMLFNCATCGGHHHKGAVHLDYVGHAALTDRLLDADPAWFWEPLATDEHGLPAFDKSGGLWIKLTVCDVTRLGYGHANAKPNMDAGAREKECIGDALRNAAMRFGAALDLWHKGDLHPDDDKPEAANDANGMPDAEWSKLVALIEATKADRKALLEHFNLGDLRDMSQRQYAEAIDLLNKKLAKQAKSDSNAKGQQAGGFGPILDDEIKY